MNSRLLGASYNWASGFQGMEKNSSKKEYLDEQMKQPPYIGDKRDFNFLPSLCLLYAEKQFLINAILTPFGH